MSMERFWDTHLSGNGGGHGRCRDLAPNCEAVAHFVTPFGDGQQVSARPEMWRDTADRGSELLRVPG